MEGAQGRTPITKVKQQLSGKVGQLGAMRLLGFFGNVSPRPFERRQLVVVADRPLDVPLGKPFPSKRADCLPAFHVGKRAVHLDFTL